MPGLKQELDDRAGRVRSESRMPCKGGALLCAAMPQPELIAELRKALHSGREILQNALGRLTPLRAIRNRLARDGQLRGGCLVEVEQGRSRWVLHVVVVEYELAHALDELLRGPDRRRRISLDAGLDSAQGLK